jgi:polysaccharide pyruvyl transferase WcaK-like protein
VGYAEKSAELMRSVGLADFHQGIDDLDADMLMAQLSAVRAQGPTLSTQISTACDGYETEVKALLDELGGNLLGQLRGTTRVP